MQAARLRGLQSRPQLDGQHVVRVVSKKMKTTTTRRIIYRRHFYRGAAATGRGHGNAFAFCARYVKRNIARLGWSKNYRGKSWQGGGSGRQTVVGGRQEVWQSGRRQVGPLPSATSPNAALSRFWDKLILWRLLSSFSAVCVCACVCDVCVAARWSTDVFRL